MNLRSFKNFINKMFTNNVYICIKRIWHKTTYNGRYAIKLNQTKIELIIVSYYRLCTYKIIYIYTYIYITLA